MNHLTQAIERMEPEVYYDNSGYNACRYDILARLEAMDGSNN